MSFQYYNILGLMTGTSLDGIDASIINTNGKSVNYQNMNFFKKYDSKIKKNITNFVKVFDPNKQDLNLINDLNSLITQEHIYTIKNFDTSKYDIIGLHGQTIYHNPSKLISLQIINPQKIANYFNKIVVFNFRKNDIKNNGQGAPLAPIYHKSLIEKFKLALPSCIINIGGISNITYWDGYSLIGFDCGPGNTLMDKTMQKFLNKNYDPFGNTSSAGKINKKSIDLILNDHFFKESYPKSLDNKYFDKYLERLYQDISSVEDLMSTLLNLTVFSIKLGIKRLPKKIKSIVITGGGANNTELIKQIKNQIKIPFINLEIDKNFIESELICYLSARKLNNLPITFPKTTGVKLPLTGGEIYKPDIL